MCLARPCTTASVTLTSGCSDVPDLSAYLRAYAHILSTFACDGSAMQLSFLIRRRSAFAGLRRSTVGESSRAGQGLVDLRRVEAAQAPLADEDHGQRRQSQLHELLARAGIA